MATTKIWSIRGDVGHVLRYVQDNEVISKSDNLLIRN